MRTCVLGIFVYLMLFFVHVYGYRHFYDSQDRGILAVMDSMQSFQVHYQNWMYYTLNVTTPGFIETGVYNTRRSSENNPIQIVPFFRWRAGPVIETGRTLDFYIDASSRGFFVVQLPTTLAYTRDGRFRLDSKNRLVTLQGNYPVMGEGGEIFILPGTEINVAFSGMIFADGQAIDKMKIAVFESFREMRHMESINGSFFILMRSISVLEGDQYYKVVQGNLEQSNVLKAITGDMMMANNSYKAAVKTGQQINKAISTAASLGGP